MCYLAVAVILNVVVAQENHYYKQEQKRQQQQQQKSSRGKRYQTKEEKAISRSNIVFCCNSVYVFEWEMGTC